MKKIFLLMFGFIISLFFSKNVFAEEPGVMPNMSVGQTTITLPGNQQSYGGLGGNQTIVNFQDDYQFSFKQSEMQLCSVRSIETIFTCFVLGSPAASLSAMKSKTFRDGAADLEIATLLYPENSINGDVHGAANLLPGFSQFGKHLYTTPGFNSSSSAFYKMFDYQFNKKAQAYWPNGGNNKAMVDTVNRLKSNTKTLNAPNNIVGPGNYWLRSDFNGICGLGASCDDYYQYPNGRVWHSAPIGGWGLLSNSSVVYRDKSTIIIEKGGSNKIDVQINNSFKKQNAESSIGFIVTGGDVLIQNTGNSKITIEASIFVPNGSIKISGSNIDLIGAFVAKDFVVSGSSNVNFIQDTRDESVWPPGFREFKSITSTSN